MYTLFDTYKLRLFSVAFRVRFCTLGICAKTMILYFDYYTDVFMRENLHVNPPFTLLV